VAEKPGTPSILHDPLDGKAALDALYIVIFIPGLTLAVSFFFK
jgi:hypothetical protein